jgi:hypothetical protein
MVMNLQMTQSRELLNCLISSTAQGKLCIMRSISHLPDTKHDTLLLHGELKYKSKLIKLDISDHWDTSEEQTIMMLYIETCNYGMGFLDVSWEKLCYTKLSFGNSL